MRILLSLLIAAVTMCGATHIPAAEINRYKFQGTDIIILKGPMVNEDVERFRSVAAGITSGTVVLSSDGGSLHAGIEIGKTIRMRGLATWVSSQQGSCMSACSFAWVAGTPRMLDERARVGFHAAYIWEDGKPVMTGSGNALVGAYLRDIGLSDEAIFYATEARPESMRFLTREDALRIGLSLKYLAEPRSRQEQDARWQWAVPRGEIPVPSLGEGENETADRSDIAPQIDFSFRTQGDAEAFLYEERAGHVPLAISGRVNWWTMDTPAGMAIEARVLFPLKKFAASIKITRNADSAVPASHIWEFTFSGTENLGASVQTIRRIAFKQTEQDRGNELIGVAAKLSEVRHLLALNDDSRAITTNRDLMIGREWIDVPVTLSDQKRILLTFRKGLVGERVFQRAFAEWAAFEVHRDPNSNSELKPSRQWRYATGFNLLGADLNLSGTRVKSMSVCRSLCEREAKCVAYSMDLTANKCFLKQEVDKARRDFRFSSGYYEDTPIAFQQ